MITLALEEVTKTYPLGKESTVMAVEQASLEVAKGEFLVITGRSGSGKTTLLNLMSGLTRPTSGQVRLNEFDLWSLADAQRSVLRGQQIGFIFQFPSLLPALTAFENVKLPSIFMGKSVENHAEQRANELLSIVGLEDKCRAYPRQLSAGQQQRVVVARALFNRPQVLLADEPTSNLDEQTEQEIMALFKQVHQQTGVTIILVTHTSQLVSYGTRSIQMTGGRIANASVSPVVSPIA